METPDRNRKPYSSKVVMVTGGAKGIGREIAARFGRAGACLAITGRDAAALEGQARRFSEEGIEVEAIPGDVTRLEDCRAAVDRAVARFGRLDVLVNNAGASMRGDFMDTSMDLFRYMIDLNLMGAVYMSSCALPSLVAARGSLVFISSLVGLKGLPGVAPYSVGKMGLTALSESLRCELAGKGLHVGIVYVGMTDNDPGKIVYDSKGALVPLVRPRNHSTQAQVADAVYRLVRLRRRSVTMTSLGKLARLAYTLAPGLSERLIAHFTAGGPLVGMEKAR